MKVIEIKTDKALKAHKEADLYGKMLLENLFGKEIFTTNITDRIKNFEDACLEVGEDPKDEKFLTGPDDEIAFMQLKIITKALNEGWTPDWTNEGQYKYFP